MTEAWPGGPDWAQIASWHMSPEQRAAKAQARDESHGQWQSARAVEESGHKRTLEAIQRLMAAGGPGRVSRRHEALCQTGTWRKRVEKREVDLPQLASAWPVGPVLWEQQQGGMLEHYVEVPTGITADGELVPMNRLRRAEAELLAAEDPRFNPNPHVIVHVIRPQYSKQSGELRITQGTFAAQMEAYVERYLR